VASSTHTLIEQFDKSSYSTILVNYTFIVEKTDDHTIVASRTGVFKIMYTRIIDEISTLEDSIFEYGKTYNTEGLTLTGDKDATKINLYLDNYITSPANTVYYTLDIKVLTKPY
jgi:hypothetical protein